MFYRIKACNSYPMSRICLYLGNKLIVFFLFIFTMAIAQEGKPTVAILDFEGQGVDAAEVQTLTERMRTEIGNTKAEPRFYHASRSFRLILNAQAIKKVPSFSSVLINQLEFCIGKNKSYKISS